MSTFDSLMSKSNTIIASVFGSSFVHDRTSTTLSEAVLNIGESLYNEETGIMERQEATLGWETSLLSGVVAGDFFSQSGSAWEVIEPPRVDTGWTEAAIMRIKTPKVGAM